MTDVCVIVDESGSMDARRDQTVVAINSYFDGVREDQSADHVYLYMFHSHGTTGGLNMTKVYDGQHINTITRFGKDNYQPRGMTPLYDAVGHALEELVGNRMFVVVLTDGEENTSREYNKNSLKALIESKESLGWDFIFLGAEFDAWGGNARDLGIPLGKTLAYTDAQTNAAWRATRAATATYTTTGHRLPDDHFTTNDYQDGYFDPD